MTYLALAKQTEARLRSARQNQPPHEKNESTKEVAPDLPERRHIDAYRAALRECWRLLSLGPDADPATADRVRGEVFRLEDEVGEPRASQLRHVWAVEWHRETRQCPGCGEPGETHREPGGCLKNW
jgi:hypothetical protein